MTVTNTELWALRGASYLLCTIPSSLWSQWCHCGSSFAFVVEVLTCYKDDLRCPTHICHLLPTAFIRCEKAFSQVCHFEFSVAKKISLELVFTDIICAHQNTEKYRRLQDDGYRSAKVLLCFGILGLITTEFFKQDLCCQTKKGDLWSQAKKWWAKGKHWFFSTFIVPEQGGVQWA